MRCQATCRNAALAALLAGAAAATPTAELADAAARIDYGYYSGDARIVEAAVSSLERLTEGGALARYYEALASFRLAALAAAAGRDPRAWLDRCMQAAGASELPDAAAAEAFVLAAACASRAARAEPMRAVLHNRRAQAALERAAALDPVNPRLALIEAERLAEEGGREAEAVARLESALAEFAARAGDAPQSGVPQWGEAEALVALAELRYAAGDARRARDLLERALLVAPEYRAALELQARVLGAR
ncbi:MAG TPA: hypothetical protein VF322_14100 [Gammaproteobacteria bacterium]